MGDGTYEGLKPLRPLLSTGVALLGANRTEHIKSVHGVDQGRLPGGGEFEASLKGGEKEMTPIKH